MILFGHLGVSLTELVLSTCIWVHVFEYNVFGWCVNLVWFGRVWYGLVDFVASTSKIATCKTSTMVTFSRQIRWWGQFSCSAVQISWLEGKITINWDTHQGI